MRDCVILVADLGMIAAFRGFFLREQFHLTLGTGEFNFDIDQDLKCDNQGNDPGVYTRAHELLRPLKNEYRKAIIVLDEAWDGSPGAEKIYNDILQNMMAADWDREDFEVIVIVPELENWMWQANDNPNIKQAFRFDKHMSLKQWLHEAGKWDPELPKPEDPKAAFEHVLYNSKAKTPSAVFNTICSNVSVRGCVDESFIAFQSALQKWYPMDYS